MNEGLVSVMIRFCFYPVVRLFILWVKMRLRIGRVEFLVKETRIIFIYILVSGWVYVICSFWSTPVSDHLSPFPAQGDLKSCTVLCVPSSVLWRQASGSLWETLENVLLSSRTLKAEGGLMHPDMKSFEEYNLLKRTHYHLYYFHLELCECGLDFRFF